MSYTDLKRVMTNAIIQHVGSTVLPRHVAEQIIDRLEKKYSEPHRYWHTWHHVNNVVEQVIRTVNDPCVIVAAIFHDVVYTPGASDNELNSFLYYLDVLPVAKESPEAETVKSYIMDTASRKPPMDSPHYFGATLWRADNEILLSTNFGALLEWEKRISREYSCIHYPTYRAGRLDFLNREGFETNPLLENLAEYVRTRIPRIGIYAGSFDPFHLGHLNVALQARDIFDKVIIAVGTNPGKQSEELEHRRKQLKPLEILFEVIAFEGTLHEAIRSVGRYGDVTLIRGLRDGYDLKAELVQQNVLKFLYPGLKTVYIACDQQFQYISSTMLRELKQLNLMDAYHHYVTDERRILTEGGKTE